MASSVTSSAKPLVAGRAAVEEQSWEKVIARFEGDLACAAGVERAPSGAAPALA